VRPLRQLRCLACSRCVPAGQQHPHHRQPECCSRSPWHNFTSAPVRAQTSTRAASSAPRAGSMSCCSSCRAPRVWLATRAWPCTSRRPTSPSAATSSLRPACTFRAACVCMLGAGRGVQGKRQGLAASPWTEWECNDHNCGEEEH